MRLDCSDTLSMSILTRKMKKLLAIILILITILLCSCTKDGIVKDFSDMSKLRDSLSQVFPDEDIRTNISNGSYIVVSFVNSDLKKLEKAEKGEIAKIVGLITSHFFDKERVSNGSLAFVTYKNYIVFKYTISTDAYDLQISE